MNHQKGFALIIALFLVVAMTAIAAGSFLSLGSQQRTVQRAVERIKLYWVAEGVIDQQLKLFSDFVETNAKYPYGNSGAPKVLNGTTDSGETFDALLRAWFMKRGDPANTDSPMKHLFAKFELDPKGTTVRFVRSLDATGNPLNSDGNDETDPYREYEIAAKVISKLSGQSLWVKQKIKLSAGKLFDYDVFYNGDLEIASGPNYELQGPVFTNGNVYLMTGEDQSLTFLTPQGVSTTDKNYYALHAAGNIYFYFKRLIGRNYFLDGCDQGKCRNPVYAAGVPDYYRTDRSDPAVFKNSWTADPGLNGVEISRNGEVRGAVYPLFYYPKNSLRKQTKNHWVSLKDAQNPTTPISLKYPEFICHGWEDLYCCIDNPFYSAYFDQKNYGKDNDFLSVTPAFDPSKPLSYPKMLPSAAEWDPEKPLSELPTVNPNWKDPAKNTLGSLVADHESLPSITSKTIPIGDPNAEEGTHLLIDPLKGDENPFVKALKLESKAHVRILCGGAVCTGTVFSGNGKPLAVDGYFPVELPGITIESFYDYRLGGTFPSAVIDVGALSAYMQAAVDGGDIEKNVTGSGFNGFLVYVEVAPAPYPKTGESRIALVRLKNGTKLPSSGLTVATNGRLWVQGSYNTYDYGDNGTGRVEGYCNETNWDAKNCRFPAAALVSDSFGVLSGENLSSQQVSFGNRLVSQNTMLNAAVITGALPSQLQEMFPNCNADNPSECWIWSPSYANELLRPANNSGLSQFLGGSFEKAGDWYLPSGAKWNCPEGLYPQGHEQEGDPKNWFNCETRQDMETGIFYAPRLAIVKRVYNTMWFEYDGTYYDYGTITGGLATKRTDPWEVQHCLLTQQTRWASYMDQLNPPGLPQKRWDPTIYLAPPSPNQAGTSLERVLYKIVKAGEGGVEKWDDLTQAEKDLITTELFRTYKIPVARQDNGVWNLLCCDVTNAEGQCASFGTNRICHPNESGFNPEQVSYRIVEINANIVAHREMPRNTTRFMKCPGDTQWKPTPYGVSGDCEIEGAPAMGGVYTDSMIMDWTPVWNHIQISSLGALWEQITCKIPEGGTTPVCVTIPAGSQGPTLRFGKSSYGYNGGRYIPLYMPRYSGGLENLINYQEAWDQTAVAGNANAPVRAMRHYGILTSAWDSKLLETQDASGKTFKAFWSPRYYSAPKRTTRYNEQLKEDPPPGMPCVYGITRGRFEELDSGSGQSMVYK